MNPKGHMLQMLVMLADKPKIRFGFLNFFFLKQFFLLSAPDLVLKRLLLFIKDIVSMHMLPATAALVTSIVVVSGCATIEYPHTRKAC